jgi:hypothetical protein
VHVLGDRVARGRETVLAPPPGDCHLGAVTAAHVAYLCFQWDADHLVLQSPVDGSTWEPPGSATLRGLGSSEEGQTLSAIGARLAQLETFGHDGEVIAEYVPLAGGPMFHRPPLTTTRVLSLDAPSGVRRLCSPLRVGTHREDDPDGGSVGGSITVRDAAAYRPPWLLTLHGSRVLLRHCAGRRVRTLGQGVGPLFLTRRYAAWIERDRVAVRMLRSGRTMHFAPYMAFASPPALLSGTDHRLWFGDDRHNTYIIAL